MEARVAAIRSQNDGLVATVKALGLPDDAPFVFLCECGDPFCIDLVTLTVGECAVRRGEGGFLLCPGHRGAGTRQAA